MAQAWRGKTFPDDPFKESNVRGTVAFAFAAKDGRTTQVFINLVDNSAGHDQEPFVPFGRIVEGMDVVDAIAAVPTGYADRPIEPVRIKKVTLEGETVEEPEKL